MAINQLKKRLAREKAAREAKQQQEGPSPKPAPVEAAPRARRAR